MIMLKLDYTKKPSIRVYRKLDLLDYTLVEVCWLKTK